MFLCDIPYISHFSHHSSLSKHILSLLHRSRSCSFFLLSLLSRSVSHKRMRSGSYCVIPITLFQMIMCVLLCNRCPDPISLCMFSHFFSFLSLHISSGLPRIFLSPPLLPYITPRPLSLFTLNLQWLHTLWWEINHKQMMCYLVSSSPVGNQNSFLRSHEDEKVAIDLLPTPQPSLKGVFPLSLLTPLLVWISLNKVHNMWPCLFYSDSLPCPQVFFFFQRLNLSHENFPWITNKS